LPVVGCPKQKPARQVSPPVQSLPSSHGSEFGVAMQMPSALHASVVQEFESALQGVPMGSGSPWHTVPMQSSFDVQSLPSSHVDPCWTAEWPHVPSPSHRSSVQSLSSLSHGLPFASNVQVAEQQSPAKLLPSSHCSPESSWPLPHGSSKSLPSGSSFCTVKFAAGKKDSSAPAMTALPCASIRTV
jgi:hypothetical protein